MEKPATNSSKKSLVLNLNLNKLSKKSLTSKGNNSKDRISSRRAKISDEFEVTIQKDSETNKLFSKIKELAKYSTNFCDI